MCPVRLYCEPKCSICHEFWETAKISTLSMVLPHYFNGAKLDVHLTKKKGFITEDYPVGTLISLKFRIIGDKLSFLLGGGCDVGKIRIELPVNGQVCVKGFCRRMS